MSTAIWNAFIAEQNTQPRPMDYSKFYDWLDAEHHDLAIDFNSFLQLSTNEVSDLFEEFTNSTLGPGEDTHWADMVGRITDTLDAMDDCTPKDAIASQFFSQFTMAEVGGLAEILYEKFFPDPPTWGTDPIDNFEKLLAAVKDGEPLSLIQETLANNFNSSKCNSTVQQNQASQFSTEAANFLAYHTVPKLFTGKIQIDSDPPSPLFSSSSGVKVLWYEDGSSEAALLASSVTNASGEFPINFASVEGIPDYTDPEYETAVVKFQDAKGNLFSITGSGTSIVVAFPPGDATEINVTLEPNTESIILYPSYAVEVSGTYDDLRDLLANAEGNVPGSGGFSDTDIVTALEAFESSYTAIGELNDVRLKGGLRNYVLTHTDVEVDPDDRYILQFDAHVFIEPLTQNMLFRRWIIYNGLQSVADIASANRSELVRLRNSFNDAQAEETDKISDYEAAALHQKAKTIAYYLDNLTIDWRINHE